MESNFKQWNLNERRHEFKEKKAKVCRDYDDEVRQLQRELSAKIDRLKMERDRKLGEISLEAARFEDSYRQWKAENFINEQKEQ